MKRLSCDERGAALLEFAIVVPLLVFVVAGIAESGLLFRSYEITVNAAREGARLAALPGSEEDDYAAPRAVVQAYLRDARLTQAGDPTPPTITFTPTTMAIGPGVTANGIRVTVTYEYDCLFLGPVIGLFNGTFVETITHQSSALMRVQTAAAGL